MGVKKRRGRGLNQNTVIGFLLEIGPYFQYAVADRKGLRRYLRSERGIPVEFRPDVFWKPAFRSTKKPRLWEVEKTVTSHTVSKSILSLLTSLAHFHLEQAKNAEGIMVVPDKSRKDVANRLRSAVQTIRAFGGQKMGAPRKIRLGVVTFEEIQRVWNIVRAYRAGPPPKIRISWVAPW